MEGHTHKEQVTRFANDLDALVNRYADEWDLDYASIIGCLQFKSHTLCMHALNREDGDQEEGGSA